MEVLTMTQRSIKLAAATLVVVSIFADICVHTKIHRLKIEFGFTLDKSYKSESSSITDYMEMNDITCVLNNSDKTDEDKQMTFSIVFFRFDFHRNLILIERRGKDVKNLSYETDNKLLTSIPLLNNGGHFSAYFRVFIKRDEEEGMYSLYFHNCLGQKEKDSSSINLTMKLVEYNPGNFLSAGEMPIPYLFFVFTAVYLAAAFLWASVLHRCREDVYKIHYLMLSVVVVKVLACLFHAVNMYYIGKDGHHEEAWAVLYYIAYLMQESLFFITILLIGADFAFIKYVLSDREKTLFLIFFVVVIPLQVLDYIAWVLVEESEEGQSHYDIWRGIFVLVDLLCCGAILFPVVWSIRRLKEGSTADGKVAIRRLKLKLFRQFYIMIVCYIYFTRIIVYLVKIAVPFRYEWLNELLKEIATAVFFFVTGYKFRPAPDNPYLQVPQKSDD